MSSPQPEGLANHIWRNLAGMAQLAQFNADGLARMDLTRRGAWRSFIAVPLAFVLVLVAQQLMPASDEPSIFADGTTGNDLRLRFLLITVLVALSWAAMVLQMGQMSSMEADRAPRLIATYNWAGLLVALVLCATSAAGAVLGMDADSLAGMGQVVDLVGMVFLWYVLRTAMQGEGLLAMGLVVLELMLQAFWVQIILYPVLRD